MESSGDRMEREELDDYVKKMQAKADAFFKRAGQDPLEVYRIEKFEPVMIQPEFHGKFYQGDSYVVCCKNKKDYDIHYWHGKESTADEQGSSAALTVQLSEHLALPSRHHLEEQNNESDLFMSHFKKGVHYLEGGCDSGFKHVTPKEYPTRLLKVKGTRYPRICQVPVKASELNEGDCFILDMGMNLYYFMGEEANKYEKLKALEIAVAIKNDERHNKPKLWYPRDIGGQYEADFWAALGGKPDKINPPEPDDAPSGTEEELARYSFYEVSNDSGKMECKEITERPLDKQKHLNTNETYILELYDMVYVWIGAKANLEEKKQAMATAKNFIKEKNKPKTTRVTRLSEMVEDSLFKSYFENFYPALNMDGGDKSTHANQDISAMANNQQKAAQLMFDKLGDNYTLKTFFVDHNAWTFEEVTAQEHGYFWAESVYFIDIKSDRHQYIIMWMGARIEGEYLAKFHDLITKYLNYEEGSDTTRMPLRKGAEDEGFLQFFTKGFYILDEQRVPFADYEKKVKEHGAMFRIQAPHGKKARAIEQNGLESKYLNSHDSYVIYTADCEKCFVWHGQGAAPAEVDGCNVTVANFFKQAGSTQEFKEGTETEEFWQILGGKGDYSTIKEGAVHPDFEPRLFTCSNRSGYFFCKEVVNFTQEDLVNSDVMMLDTWNTIYLWIGTESNDVEKRGAKKAAEKYIAGVTDGRDKQNTQIVEIKAGHEPISFTAQFIQWEPELAEQWLEADPMEKLRKAEEAKHAEEEAKANKDPFEGFLDPNTKKFKYEELRGKFPEGVKPDSKPAYLTDEEFEAVFKMKRDAYNQLKGWKQTDLRKKYELF